MSSPLSNEQILSLLSTERTSKKEDITKERTIQVWMKLNHHMCMSDCEHRANSPTERACQNPECVDPRGLDDRGINIVALVAGKHMCRYCFLNKWLLLGS